MLTLNHLHISNRIFLYRETPEFIRSVDSSLKPNEQYYVDIPFMADCIAEHITVVNPEPVLKPVLNIDPIIRKHLVYDYIFMFFMMGNDFMPHFPSMNIRTNGPTTVMDAYRVVFKNTLHPPTENQSFIHYTGLNTSTDTSTSTSTSTRPRINWSTVKQFIEYLAASEQDRIIEEHNLRTKKSGRGNDGYEHVSDPRRQWGDRYENMYELIINKCESGDDTLHLPSKERGVEFYIAPSKPDWERRYYHALFDAPITDKRCKTYYPPLLQDLVRFIPSGQSTQILLESRPMEPITSLEQLQYVLPHALQRALIPAHSGTDTDEQVKRGLVIKWAYCKYFWEAHLHY